VFLASTSHDLLLARQKVRDAVLRLEQLPVAMETFVASAGTPAAECMDKAAASDVVVVLVAHCYGYVPTPEFGGDGERSITWLEVGAARGAGKPVLAFLVDPNTPWTHAREQDRLLMEPEKAQEIVANVQRLQAFRSFLQQTCIFAMFGSDDDLAAKVTAALASLRPVVDGEPPARPERWTPRFMHSLQPALHFVGRTGLRDDLRAWCMAQWSETRVVSVVAVGGTGKTALVEQVVSSLKGKDDAGLLVWSFYEDPRTEEFLRVACEYFTGESEIPAGGRLERLQWVLSSDRPHLLVLDGLERVQAEASDGRVRGVIEDPQLKRLLRFLAGGPGQARALITTRFPVVDLHNWDGGRCRTECLDDLSRDESRAVLRGWGVRGSDEALDRLVEPLGGHALSTAVLGSFLGNLCDGDVSKAPMFRRDDAVGHDPKAAKLGRLLDEYAAALEQDQRDLLALLATFPRGATLGDMRYLTSSGRRVAGGLMRYDVSRISSMLERLKALGLLFAYGTGEARTYSAHPFLREYFQDLLRVSRHRVHDAVRSRLVATLEGRPLRPPTEKWELDQIEGLIEHTRLAGRMREAFSLYWKRLGSFSHLGKSLGENARGLRIVSGFASEGRVEKLSSDLTSEQQALLAGAWGLFSEYLGDLHAARSAFEYSLSRHEFAGLSNECVAVLLNLCEVELLSARMAAAREAAERALLVATKTHHLEQQIDAHAYLATVLGAQGDLQGAIANFDAARKLESRALYSIRGVWEAEYLARCGATAAAYKQTIQNREMCQRLRHFRDVAYCDTVLSRLLLPDDPTGARAYLSTAREFGARSGEVEIILRAHLASSELLRAVGDLTGARVEAETGILLADGCGFDFHGIDLRIALARTHLDSGDPESGLLRAREALQRSTWEGTGYAWAQADALQLVGCALAQMGDTENAGHSLSLAVVVQTALAHPSLVQTRSALAMLERYPGVPRLAVRLQPEETGIPAA
jgi:tetratricopeptide (TPR) repeat protein